MLTYIAHDKFQEYSNKALDWYIKSWMYDPEGEEYQICLLKQSILKKKAINSSLGSMLKHPSLLHCMV